MTLTSGYESLSDTVNKVGEVEDVSINLLPELTLSMDDDELLSLSKEWQKLWKPYADKIQAIQDENEKYWLGKQFNPGGEKRPTVDNLIFEALETFLPIATRPKADPQVESDNTEEGNMLADKLER